METKFRCCVCGKEEDTSHILMEKEHFDYYEGSYENWLKALSEYPDFDSIPLVKDGDIWTSPTTDFTYKYHVEGDFAGLFVYFDNEWQMLL